MRTHPLIARNAGIIAGAVAGFAVGWNITNVGAIAGRTAEDYGISLAVVGLFTTALFVTHLAMQVPGGRLVDRLGARLVCIAGMAIVGLGTAASMIAPDVGLGIGARAFTGVGTGLAFIAGTAYVRRSGGSPFAQGLYGGVGLGAGGAALAAVPQLVPWLSWRAPYASALVLAAIGLAAVALAPPDRPVRPHGPAAAPRDVLGDRRLYRLALLYSSTFGLAVVLSNWVVELLERHGFGTSSAASLGAVILLLGVITRPLGGWIMRAHKRQTRLAVGLSLAAGALGSVLLGLSGSAPAALGGCLLLGIGAGISFAPAFTGAATLRDDAPAAAVGFVNATAAATILLGTPLLGLTFSMPGEGRVGFLVVAALWLGALALLPGRTALAMTD